MVEVFKTDVKDSKEADVVLTLIHHNFKEYEANFDLDDCEKILRVKSENSVKPHFLIDLLCDLGVKAEILSDDIPQPLSRHKFLMTCIGTNSRC